VYSLKATSACEAQINQLGKFLSRQKNMKGTVRIASCPPEKRIIYLGYRNKK
jgi:hypothetical protein